MFNSQKITHVATVVTIIHLFTISTVTAYNYDPTWTRSQCATYSYHGLNERYVYGGNNGWIDNNKWDDASIEGVDCASYVSRCLALPEYVPEGERDNYPYDTRELYEGAENTTRIFNIEDLQQWDLWVYRGTSNHTGLFKQFSGSRILTREAKSATSGVVEGSYSKQWLIDKGARFYRRSNWVSDPEPPTVVTNAATAILYASAKLNATISSGGSTSVDQRGFDWGTTSACSNGWLEGNVSGDNFSASLIGLTGDTTYYFKARAHNSAGWASGSVLSFRTEPTPANPEYIIDNGNDGTSYTGTWKTSEAQYPYGDDSFYGRDGATYTWSYNYLPAGVYNVSVWWTELSSRTDQAPFTVYHAGGSAQTIVNQQTNGGQWNTLGKYYFDGNASVKLVADDVYPVSFCADAVKFALVHDNQTPIAIIDSISPQTSTEGNTVSFSGHGTDDGSITAYSWSSNLDGALSSSASFSTAGLSNGSHTISFRVRDNDNVWSDPTSQTITVMEKTGPSQVIIDNGDAGTSSTGTWKVSGGENPYGDNSLYGRDGAVYTWSTPLVPGTYEVFMWWTDFSSRSEEVPLQINDADGTFDFTVNQQVDGGQWNSLGQFEFNTSGSVTLLAPGAYPNSYSVDAVMFQPIEVTPVSAGFTASPISGNIPLTVTFSNQSSGSISSYQWDFDNDGDIDSTSPNPSYQYSNAGNYTVRLIVSGPGGNEELVRKDYIRAIDPTAPEEIIVDNDDEDTSFTGTWGISGGADPYGSNSLWARNEGDFTWYVTPQLGGTYEVFLWWTEFSSRGSAVPVAINHQDGTTNFKVSQQSNGGQWNSMGTYRMQAGESYFIRVYTIGDSSTTSADAVRIVRVSN